MPGKNGKVDAELSRRLVGRVGLLCLAPLLAAILKLGTKHVLVCIAVSLVWSGLEASIVYKLKFSAQCRMVPFIFRLLAASFLDLQAYWFVAPSHTAVASASSLAIPIETLSIVLPCANEGEFVMKTVKAVFQATPSEELKEIIVVDDASDPVISRNSDPAELEANRAHIIRHDESQGLIRSKKDGADSAKGDIIVFLDCHVRPIPGWTEDLFSNIRENPKRIVVPTISSLDPDTWEEVDSAGGQKMCLTWNADFFWCNGYPGPYVPIMSGGLLALSRYWWETTGGYDDKMQAWGGENLDQSLRTWLCGGEIVVAASARVAHMWRDPSKPKTALHYAIPTEHVLRNRLRAATSWMGPWANKVRSFPEFSEFNPGGSWQLGTFENVKRYTDDLQCKDFKWYLDKFHDLYAKIGTLPNQVYNLRHKSSQLCLHHELTYQSVNGGLMNLRPCNRFSEAQRFHDANMDTYTRECCSGIKMWDIDICVSAMETGRSVVAEQCVNFGESQNQWMKVNDKGLLEWRNGAGCAIPDATALANKVAAYNQHKAQMFTGTACSSKAKVVNNDESSIKLIVGDKCFSTGEGQLWQENNRPLLFVPCADDDSKQVFTIAENGEQLKTSNGFCVDAASGEGPIAHPCHPADLDRRQQQFHAKDGSAILWRSPTESGGEDTFCLDPAVELVRLMVCATSDDGGVKSGQGFVKHDIRDNTFELRSADAAACLSAVEIQGNTHIAALPCGGQTQASSNDQRWSWDGAKLRNEGRILCVDASDTPLLAPCDEMDVSFKLLESGWIEMPRSWADNGRVRYLGKCFDTKPLEPVGVSVDDCGEALKSDALWEKVYQEIPMETQLYSEASKFRGNLRAR